MITRAELQDRQSWSLHQKIDHSLGVIDQFCSRLNNKVFVSFSGGKDSTVLLDLCRVINPNIKAVFVNTGNEFPDIVKFVRKLRDTDGYNIEIITPDLTPKQLIEKVGFPLISKEASAKIFAIRKNPESKTAKRALREDSPYHLAKRYRFLIDEEFDTSDRCCYYLKKKPMHQYQFKTGEYPILGLMASESLRRQTNYLMQGQCNNFTGKINSAPLSIWMEQDIWDYINERNLPIADIYNKGVNRTGCMFCGFGCQFKKDNRWEIIKKLHPKFYNMAMQYTNKDVPYLEALNKILRVCHKEELTLA